MSDTARLVLWWAPRVLGGLFACFVAIFAADVFDDHQGFWRTLAALAIHLVPTGLLLLILALAWRREWVGGVFYLALGVLYCRWAWGRLDWTAFVLIAGPLFVLSVLFWVNWAYRAQLRPAG